MVPMPPSRILPRISYFPSINVPGSCKVGLGSLPDDSSPHNPRTTPAVPRIPGVQGARAPCAWTLAGYFVRPPLRRLNEAGDLLVPRAPADGRRRRSSSSRRKISRGNKVYLGNAQYRRDGHSSLNEMHVFRLGVRELS